MPDEGILVIEKGFAVQWGLFEALFSSLSEVRL
jgi:hypothetical protein